MKKEGSQIHLNFETRVSVLPTAVVDFVDKAKKFDLKVLLLIASSEKYREGDYIFNLSKALGTQEIDVTSSVAFWNGTGIICISDSSEIEDTAALKKVEQEPKKDIKELPNEAVAESPRRVRISDMPQYSSSELNGLLEKYKNSVELIDECQNILGKVFIAPDIKVLMALVDYLELSQDYILVLMHYCARNDIRSMRAVEKLAVSCLDEGFLDAGVLERELYAREERRDLEYKIKNVFGDPQRKLTTKEKKHLEAWINTYKFDLDVIERAYEITINSTSKPSMHYTNAILEKWYAAGVRSLEDAKALLLEESDKRADGSSFNVDDFFSAALKRSYSDKV